MMIILDFTTSTATVIEDEDEQRDEYDRMEADNDNVVEVAASVPA